MEEGRITKAELNKMIQEATVDCYNEDEAFMGVLYYLADNISFPFKAKAFGDMAEVIGIDDEESELEREVMATIRMEGDEYTISLDELELEPDDTENARWLEMYEYWISRFNP